MCFFVAIVFIVVPILEVLLFWTLIIHFGFMPILALTLLTSFIGSSLLQIHKTHSRLDAARLIQGDPQKALADHFGVWLSGVLLLMPGFITDLFGVFLLIPWCRYLILAILMKFSRYSLLNRYQRGMANGQFHDFYRNEEQNDDHDDLQDVDDQDQGDIIDVEATPITKRKSADDVYHEVEGVVSSSSSGESSDREEEIIDVEFKINKDR